MYVPFGSPYGWQVLHVDDGQAHLVAATIDEDHARRVARLLTHEARLDQLLDRHGLVDVPTSALPTEA